jgi:hypothetical protein
MSNSSGRDDTSAQTRTCRAPRRRVCYHFEDLCLMGKGEHPRFQQLKYLHKTFALESIENVLLTNYHECFRKVCLSSPLPIRDLYASTHPQPLSCSQHSELLLLLYHIATPPLPPAPQNTLRRKSPSAPFFRLPSAEPKLSCSSISAPSSRQRPKSSSHHQTVIKTVGGIDAGETRPGWTRLPAMKIMCG